jgi:cob(I)alamin adenosyltransferase
MKIYTRKGDDGTTGLIGGTRVPKHHIRIEAYGTVDELNSWLGLLADQEAAAANREFIREVQCILFSMGSHLASDPDAARMTLPEITPAQVNALEQSIDEMEKHLPALKNFILAGGHVAVSTAHIARTICRRAERCTVLLHENSPVDEIILRYLNRLSDWLFVFGRYLAHTTQSTEILWKP